MGFIRRRTVGLAFTFAPTALLAAARVCLADTVDPTAAPVTGPIVIVLIVGGVLGAVVVMLRRGDPPG